MNPQSRSGARLRAWPLCPFAYAPAYELRAERFELSPKHVLSMPPLPFGLRARALKIGAGGETRTHKVRLLRTACLPFAPLPRRMLGEGIEPSRGLRDPRRPRRRAFAISPPQPKLLRTTISADDSGGRTRTLVSCSKDRRPPAGRPRKVKRTRHDSNVRPQAPQTCALSV